MQLWCINLWPGPHGEERLACDCRFNGSLVFCLTESGQATVPFNPGGSVDLHRRMTGMTSETKKKIRPGLIEADPRESQILVHYETDEIVDGKVPN